MRCKFFSNNNAHPQQCFSKETWAAAALVIWLITEPRHEIKNAQVLPFTWSSFCFFFLLFERLQVARVENHVSLKSISKNAFLCNLHMNMTTEMIIRHTKLKYNLNAFTFDLQRKILKKIRENTNFLFHLKDVSDGKKIWNYFFFPKSKWLAPPKFRYLVDIVGIVTPIFLRKAIREVVLLFVQRIYWELFLLALSFYVSSVFSL